MSRSSSSLSTQDQLVKMEQMRVQSLNGDSTFLITLPSNSTSTQQPLTILTDPWLVGPSTVYHSKLAHTTLSHTPSITHLSCLPTPPSLVIVSQDKSDHCHKETLCQLPSSLEQTIILAHPAAYKLIKSWNYFNMRRVIPMPVFRLKRVSETSLKFPIKSQIPTGRDGSIEVSMVMSRRDITGLHNAIGIIYRAPDGEPSALEMPLDVIQAREQDLAQRRAKLTSPSMQTLRSKFKLNMSKRSLVLPPTPPESPPLPLLENEAPPVPAIPSHFQTQSQIQSPPLSPVLYDMTRPLSPRPSTLSSRTASFTLLSPSISSTLPPPSANISPPTLSILYSPHGIPPAQTTSYLSHLHHQNALPLTLLLHSMNEITNPWYFGGTICMGSPGGVEIARRTRTKTWLGAHDGEKSDTGFLTTMITRRLWDVSDIESQVGNGTRCRGLRSGEVWCVS